MMIESPFANIPFVYRLAGLIIVTIAIALWDYKKNGPSGTRWREYSFLLAAALFGGVFGLLNDIITSRLSPEYFLYGKGLPGGPGFHQRVLILGFQAGFGAAFMAGAGFLFANNPKPGLPPLPYTTLGRLALLPLVGAIVLALILGISSAWYIHPSLDPRLTRDLGPVAAVSFWRVWCIHLGLYLGLLLGTIAAIVQLRRKRRLSMVALP